jgi:hypothetical protein
LAVDIEDGEAEGDRFFEIAQTIVVGEIGGQE